MTNEEFYLDLNKDILYGKESPRNSFLVSSIIEGINLGHVFPAVNLYSRYGDKDVISDGHHRAIARYITNTPLKAVRDVWIHDGDIFLLKDIELVEDMRYGLGHRLIGSLKYLPQDVAERFCIGNSLDLKEYLS